MPKLPYSGPRLSKILAEQRALSRPIAKKPKAADAVPILARLQQGIALQKQGNLGGAVEIYRSVLAMQPTHPDALHLMGTAAMAVMQVDSAIDYFKRAVAQKSADPSIRVNLANALLQNGDAATAEFHLHKALKLVPGLAAALCLLANCRSALGDNEGARHIYEEVLAGNPDHAQALIGYAELCRTLGELEKARVTYRRAESFSPVLALAGLANCEKLAQDSREAAEILRYLREPRLKPLEYRQLSYAAASIAAAAGEYDEAFGHFSRAKDVGRSTFDIGAHRRMLSTFKSVFASRFFAEHAKYGSQDARPVFVVGMPRSGTTLAEQIISRHSEVAAAGELQEIGRLAASLGMREEDAGRDYAKRLEKLTPPAAKELADRYLTVLDRVSRSHRRITDKMPQNFLHLGLIALLFPKARIIHCRRDPLDTCLSCFTTPLRDHYHSYASDLVTLGLYYREYVELMAHWRAVLPQPMHELEYERLVESPESESRKLIAFLQLPWDPACLAPDESARPVRTSSRMQVRQPIYRSSIGRWRHYDRHLSPLKAALGDLVQGQANSNP